MAEDLVDKIKKTIISKMDSSKHDILIVDDNVEFTNSLKRSLKDEYNIQSANSLKQAAQRLSFNEFAVIILDYDLRDEITGIDFSNYIRRMYPLTYIIMATGHTDFIIAKKALNKGSINYFFTKPIEPQNFFTAISNGVKAFLEHKNLLSKMNTHSELADAQSFITKILDETKPDTIYQIDVVGLIISKGSIPVYSKFYRGGIFNEISNTLFAGFMNALVHVGQELFSKSKHDDQALTSINFGSVYISFKLIDEFHVSLILMANADTTPNDTNSRTCIQKFYNQLTQEIIRDNEFYKKYSDEDTYIEELLVDLQQGLDSIEI